MAVRSVGRSPPEAIAVDKRASYCSTVRSCPWRGGFLSRVPSLGFLCLRKGFLNGIQKHGRVKQLGLERVPHGLVVAYIGRCRPFEQARCPRKTWEV